MKRSLIFRAAKRVHGSVSANALRVQDQALAQLVEGNVEGAVATLSGATPRARRLTLMRSVHTNPNPNHPRIARAPTPEQQVAFFMAVRRLTKLPTADDLLFHVALTYQAVEAGTGSACQEAAAFLQQRIPALKHIRAYLNEPIKSAKRGHHFFYSASLALTHAAIANRDASLFEASVNDVTSFFTTSSLKTKDKGFGFALPNAMTIAALATLYWLLKDEKSKAEKSAEAMSAMFRLAISRKVGPMEAPQVMRAVRMLDEIRFVRKERDPDAMANAFQNLVRVRDEQIADRLHRNFLLMSRGDATNQGSDV